MKRRGTAAIHEVIVLIALIVFLAPLPAGAADQALVMVKDMPRCLKPGQKVSVHAFVTNTGNVNWQTLDCPPEITPGDLPGAASDCRHALEYFINGTSIRGGGRSERLWSVPGKVWEVSVPFCASDTSKTLHCDNPATTPLAVGNYTVHWQVAHEWVSWVPNIATFSFRVADDCSSQQPLAPSQQSKPAIQSMAQPKGVAAPKPAFYDLGITRFRLYREPSDGSYKEFNTGSGANLGTGILPQSAEKAWNVPALPEKAIGREQRYKICCDAIAILPPREQITPAEAAHWGDGRHLVKVRLSINPPAMADGPAITRCTAEKILPIPAWSWDYIQGRTNRSVFGVDPVCVTWAPTKEDIGKTFIPQCGIFPEGGWRQGDYSGATAGVEDLSDTYPKIQVVASDRPKINPQSIKKLKK